MAKPKGMGLKPHLFSNSGDMILISDDKYTYRIQWSEEDNEYLGNVLNL